MKDFRDKVAVVTGAASGIGRGLAEKCVQEDMKVVLADVETPALEQAEAELKTEGGHVLAVQTDVTKEHDIEQLAGKTVEKFGAVHLLFNNAGVSVGASPLWELTPLDWQWIMGANLWGVIHGLKVFIPIMLRQDSECHILNTASIAGLSSVSTTAYAMTKHGIVGLTEALHLQLRQIDAKIKVSVLCPGLIKSQILDSERNRPAELQNESVAQTMTPQQQAIREKFLQLRETAMSPAQYADRVFKSIREEKFYIFSEDKYKENVRQRMEIILNDGAPELSTYFP
jgi:NAD(P)-dependent dehydrogenase (short-subunit alcohol dehydrogenase family)